MELIIGLLSGAVGGNVAGGLLKKFDQGTLINSLAGIVGGGLGGTILGMLGAPDMAGAAGEAGGLDLGAIIGQVAGGGVGGGALLAIVGMVRNAMGK
ncbi:hypothetical protein [Tropicibacter oceani]|uniref:DNA methyltransferase n=1 Tax=Tropicibacter oceani TaxID=3058420 RepID=A0ABY8QM46_9RHOB|nr:hypothetical protein [Tropicibacter oceani]WGW04857.1 hypothetical protein QF118_04715 [Tropicibacter oceani]